MNASEEALSIHTPEALRDARDIGEARKGTALIRTEQRNQVEVWRFQRDLLARMLLVGSATTDDLSPDLRKTFKKNAGNWRGAAVRRLVSDRIIKSAGITKCRRASRHGSPLTLWEPVDVDSAKDRLAYLERLIGAFQRPDVDAVSQPEMPTSAATKQHEPKPERPSAPAKQPMLPGINGASARLRDAEPAISHGKGER